MPLHTCMINAQIIILTMHNDRSHLARVTCLSSVTVPLIRKDQTVLLIFFYGQAADVGINSVKAMATKRRRSIPQCENESHIAATQMSIAVQQLLQDVIQQIKDSLYTAEKEIRVLKFKLLHRESVVAQDVVKLNKAIEERSSTENTLESLRNRAREDRAGFADLKKRLIDAKKEAVDGWELSKQHADALTIRFATLEKQKTELELQILKQEKKTLELTLTSATFRQ